MKLATFNIQKPFHRDEAIRKRTLKAKCMSTGSVTARDLLKNTNTARIECRRIKNLVFLIGIRQDFHQPYAVLRRRAGFLFFWRARITPRSSRMRLPIGAAVSPCRRFHKRCSQKQARVDCRRSIRGYFVIAGKLGGQGVVEEFNRVPSLKWVVVPSTRSSVVQGNDKHGLWNGHTDQERIYRFAIDSKPIF